MMHIMRSRPSISTIHCLMQGCRLNCIFTDMAGMQGVSNQGMVFRSEPGIIVFRNGLLTWDCLKNPQEQERLLRDPLVFSFTVCVPSLPKMYLHRSIRCAALA